MIRYILGRVLRIEGIVMLLPCLVALIYQERQGIVYLCCGAVIFLIGFALSAKKPRDTAFYQKDGFAAVALSWIVISLFGAIPFVITREIPFYIDALFEIVSGFTTTGASILQDVEALSHASLIWRSFSHWIGGMGVLVFLLMLMPGEGGSRMNLMRAESPGPSVSKFVPHVRDTAIRLYQIYIALTLAEIGLLILSGMACFDAVCISFGTAGTGGFGVLNTSCASYTAIQQIIITVFMIMFGMNFTFYYLILRKKAGMALRMEEVRAYIIVILVAIGLITINIMTLYPTFGDALRNASFQVGSVITTTGFSTVDFNLWPQLSRMILLALMFIGACAGSTGGGLKVSRVLILGKTIRRELKSVAHPRSVNKIRMDGQQVPHETLRSINVYLVIFILIFIVSFLVISLDNFSMEANFSAVAATINNIGPGLDIVGPAGHYADFSVLSKLVLSFDMLVGRLELLPMLILFLPSTWKRRG